jgi:protein-L-isoaspartate(D-aspartate) O-methyltransferase
MRACIAIGALAFAVAAGCKSSSPKADKDPTVKEPATNERAKALTPAGDLPDPFAVERAELVTNWIAGAGITDPLVIGAIGAVPRHELVPERLQWRAYHDRALPIGHEQTISQPYIVALMTESAELSKASRVLEVGTGSGYQAAVLAEIAAEVYTIEIVEELGKKARADLERMGYDNIEFRIGDGYRGWPEAAPFDAIIVTAAPVHVPEPLKEQLKVGGKLVIPVGEDRQDLVVITRTADGYSEDSVAAVLFVPMTGEAQESVR